MALLACLGYLMMVSPPFCAAELTTVYLDYVDYGTTAYGGYRWRDVAGQLYSDDYRTTYSYNQTDVTVQVTFERVDTTLYGTLSATNLKPNFAYQLKLAGEPSAPTINERIGFAGRWWQETWNGTKWANGQNLNNKGDGSSPNPNDLTYLARRDIEDPSSPTGKKYKFTSYLVFDYFITDENGNASLNFEANSSYHVLWNTIQRTRTSNDGTTKTTTFDPDPSQPAYDTDYPENTISIFGEWERLPVGGVYLKPGDYGCEIYLTEESFHGWPGGTYTGGWAAAMGAPIEFRIVPENPKILFKRLSSAGDETINPDIAIALSEPTSDTVTVDYNITGGTAVRPDDYTLTTGTLQFNAGQTTKTISIMVNNDTIDEQPGETIILELSNPSYASLGANSQHIYTIRDDDHSPTFTSATIAQNPIYPDTTLSVNKIDWYDTDGDPEGYKYQWKRNDSAIDGATSPTLDGSNFVEGDTMSCLVTAFDGTNEGNTIETPPITVSPPSHSRVKRWKLYSTTIQEQGAAGGVIHVSAGNFCTCTKRHSNVGLSKIFKGENYENYRKSKEANAHRHRCCGTHRRESRIACARTH